MSANCTGKKSLGNQGRTSIHSLTAMYRSALRGKTADCRLKQPAVFASLRSVQGAGLACRLGRRFKAFHALRSPPATRAPLRGLHRVADGLFCREIDGLFCRSSPDIIVRRRCVLSHKRRGWLQPSPSFRYSRNLALQDELYHPVINNGPAVLVCVDKRLGTGPVNQSRDAG